MENISSINHIIYYKKIYLLLLITFNTLQPTSKWPNNLLTGITRGGLGASLIMFLADDLLHSDKQELLKYTIVGAITGLGAGFLSSHVTHCWNKKNKNSHQTMPGLNQGTILCINLFGSTTIINTFLIHPDLYHPQLHSFSLGSLAGTITGIQLYKAYYQNKLNNKLLKAAEYCDNSKLKNLLHKGANTNYQDRKGQTGLHYAARSGRGGNIDTLLEHKADPCIKDQEGNTALHLSKGYNTKIKKFVRHGAKLNAHNNLEQTPLHTAALHSNYRLIEKLIKKHKMNPNQKDINGNTMLHLIAQPSSKRNPFSKRKIPQLIVTYARNINARNNLGQTPLHTAVQLCNDNAVEVFLEQGADPNFQDLKGTTPLQLAFESNLFPVCTQHLYFFDKNCLTCQTEFSTKNILKSLFNHALKQQIICSNITEEKPKFALFLRDSSLKVVAQNLSEFDRNEIFHIIKNNLLIPEYDHYPLPEDGDDFLKLHLID